MAGAVWHGIVSVYFVVSEAVLFFRFVICLDNRHKSMIYPRQYVLALIQDKIPLVFIFTTEQTQ